MVVLTKVLSWGWGVPNTSRTTSLDLFPLCQMGTVHLDGCGGATE